MYREGYWMGSNKKERQSYKGPNGYDIEAS